MSNWSHEGDMAKAVARQLQAEHLERIAHDGQDFIDQEPVMIGDTKSIMSKISFRWRADEESLLDRIRAAADTVITNLYNDANTIIDEFYGQLRIPEHNEETGMVQRDSLGRMVWKKDQYGKEIEDWSQITGQDIETCLFDMERLKLKISPRVNELLMEAVFAKHLYDDQYQDAYAELLEETIPGRNAYAARKTRQEKYHAFFCYYLWSSAKTVLAEIENFCRILERVRHWRVEENKYGKTTPALRS